jgi:hypothetical protein
MHAVLRPVVLYLSHCVQDKGNAVPKGVAKIICFSFVGVDVEKNLRGRGNM